MQGWLDVVQRIAIFRSKAHTYYLAVKEGEYEAASSSRNENSNLWDKLWHAHVPPKISNF